MPISERIVAAFICVGLAIAVPAGPAAAFDPQKVFEEEKPPIRKVFEFVFNAFKKGEDEEAVNALKYAADQGDHGAQWKLGRMYATGDRVKTDHREAFNFYKQIVDTYTNARPGTADWAFTANAMVALGHYHLNGVAEAGIPRDAHQARVMFTTAATYFGHPDAQFELARMHLDGPGQEASALQAARMLKSATRQGHAGAEALLGHMLFEGRYLQRDAVRGLHMMMNAQRRATPKDATWIAGLQEEAFALATSEERRAAVSQFQQAGVQ